MYTGGKYISDGGCWKVLKTSPFKTLFMKWIYSTENNIVKVAFEIHFLRLTVEKSFQIDAKCKSGDME